jgi:hypothetical protein
MQKKALAESIVGHHPSREKGKTGDSPQRL